MTGFEDVADERLKSLGNAGQHEDRRPNTVPLQHLQQPPRVVYDAIRNLMVWPQHGDRPVF